MKKFDSFVNEEVGIRNIKSIIGPMKTAEIYFHKDLDGVTSALAMKYFLETYYQVKKRQLILSQLVQMLKLFLEKFLIHPHLLQVT